MHSVYDFANLMVGFDWFHRVSVLEYVCIGKATTKFGEDRL